MDNRPRIKIELTPEQITLMEAVTRRPATMANLDLQVEVLEDRIAPMEGYCVKCRSK